MKIGDMVRCKADVSARTKGGEIAVVVSELRHAVNSSFIDILLDGLVIPVDWKALEVIRERL